MMMKQHKILSAILSLTFVWIGVSCSNEGDYPLEPAVQEDFIITVVQEGLSNTETRAVTDETYMTDFEEGDCIGLFAVQNGTIKDGFKNLPVTLTAGEWVPKDLNFRLDEVEEAGTTYYAYFPYDETLDISSVNTTDFFQSLVDSWALDNDQSTKEKFVDTDLMTTLEGVSVIQNEQGQYTIPLRLTHRMAMAVVSLPSVEYVFQNTDVDLNSTPYVTQPSGVAFYKGNIAEDNIVKPYLMENGSYRLIVKPGEELDIIGVANEKQYKLQTAIAAGKYKYFEVAGGRKIISDYELKVGDYYCADGRLVSGDVNKVPDDCIGVVYYVGNVQPSVIYAGEEGIDEAHDVLKATYPNCVHGLVLALELAKQDISRFCSNSKYKYKDKFTSLGLSTTHIFKPMGGSSFPELILGYNDTSILRKFHEETAASSNDLFSLLDEYTKNHPTPGFTTGWYLPSIGEFYTIYQNRDVLDNFLQKGNYEKLWSNPSSVEVGDGQYYHGYYTSTIRANAQVSGAVVDDTGEFVAYSKGNPKDAARGYFRFAFAF